MMARLVHVSQDLLTFADQHVKASMGETETQLKDASVTTWVQ